MAKQNRSRGKKIVTGTMLGLLALASVLLGTLLVIQTPNTTTRSQFFDVLTTISTDPRYQKSIPNAQPNIVRNNWSGYGVYHWGHNGVVNWGQVENYVSDMVGYRNFNACWCEYYIIDNDPNLSFHWLIWYEQEPGSYSFLFYLPDDINSPVVRISQIIYLAIIIILVVIVIILGTQIAMQLYRKK